MRFLRRGILGGTRAQNIEREREEKGNRDVRMCVRVFVCVGTARDGSRERNTIR